MLADFSGDTNHVQCLAHIVNLVVKIILHQFDMSKKKKKKNTPASELDNDNGEEDEPKITDDETEELVRVLDKEEKEMDDTPEDVDDEEIKNLVRGLKDGETCASDSL